MFVYDRFYVCLRLELLNELKDSSLVISLFFLRPEISQFSRFNDLNIRIAVKRDSVDVIGTAPSRDRSPL